MTYRLQPIAGDDRYGTHGFVDGPGREARFDNPLAIALSPDEETLYVADSGNGAIRTVDLIDGEFTVATLATLAAGWSPRHLVVHPAYGSLYYSALKWGTYADNQVESQVGQVDLVTGAVTVLHSYVGSDSTRFGAVAIADVGSDTDIVVKKRWTNQWLTCEKATGNLSEQPDHPCGPDCTYYHRDGAFSDADYGLCLTPGNHLMCAHEYVAPSGNGVCLTGGDWGFPQCGSCITPPPVHTMASTYANEWGGALWPDHVGFQLARGPANDWQPASMVMSTWAGVGLPCITILPYDEVAAGIDVDHLSRIGPVAQLNRGVAYRDFNATFLTSMAQNQSSVPADMVHNGTPLNTVCQLTTLANSMGGFVFSGSF